MYDIPDNFENTPTKLCEVHKPTPKKHQEGMTTGAELEEEKVPGGGIYYKYQEVCIMMV